MVQLFRCVDRGICLDDGSARELVSVGLVDEFGGFFLPVPPGFGEFFFFAEIEVGQQTTYRRLVTGDGLGVDPISEAALRLVRSVGLERFNLADVGRVNSAVSDATAGLDFTGQSAEQAVHSVEKEAQDSLIVQEALAVPTLPPAKSESDGCQIGKGNVKRLSVWVFLFPLVLLAGCRRRFGKRKRGRGL